MAYIERVQVETDGFLGGLDLSLSPGLNVLIGARGTGKTSVIELIRYALESGSITSDAATRGEQQAVAILDGGAVTVTVREGATAWSITRSAEGSTSTTLGEAPSTTVLAQSEVEAIGVSAAGRLRLIDRFVGGARLIESEIRSAADSLAVLTNEALGISQDIGRTDEALESLAGVEQELEVARTAQQVILAGSNATAAEQEQLLGLQAQLQAVAQREASLGFTKRSLVEVQNETQRLAARLNDLLPESTVAEAGSATHARRAASLLSTASNELAMAATDVAESETAVARERAQLDETSRTLRQRLESTQAGISQATRRVSGLEERKGQFDAIRLRRADLERRLEGVREKRLSAYSRLEGLRGARLLTRTNVAEKLNALLAPQIRVRVQGSAAFDGYVSTLVGALRGSGLHYNTLAPAIASAVAPYELVEWIERDDADALASSLNISSDRAAAVLTALRASNAGEIAASDIDDAVELELLDGTEYKPAEHLSIGQRCTVVLPILLALEGDPLIVDQPEDHLDNAFITSTLIATLRKREGNDQLLFSSHNPNIPVLGNAQHVIVMDSDGESGRISAAGPLTDPEIVRAITEIMEGGKEAFDERAKFYADTARTSR